MDKILLESFDEGDARSFYEKWPGGLRQAMESESGNARVTYTAKTYRDGTPVILVRDGSPVVTRAGKDGFDVLLKLAGQAGLCGPFG